MPTWIMLAFFQVCQPGTIETIAGTGRPELNATEGNALEFNIGQPFGVEIGPDGALYICEVENHRILRLDLQRRTIAAIAGNGKRGHGGDGGPARSASLDEPYEARFDGAGNLYVVEMKGAVVRKVEAKTGTISTIAGTGTAGYGGDGGPAAQAKLSSPHSICLAGDALFIADIGNHRIRRLDLKTGILETIAGTGEARLPAAGAAAKGNPILGPRALCEADGVLWIALREGHSIWKLDLADGLLGRAAGDGKAGYGPERFNGPKGIAFRGGRLYIVDTENQAIRRLETASGKLDTVAGSGPEGRGYGGDGGPAAAAKMDRPHGIAVDGKGVLYIGDTSNHRVRRVIP